MWSHDTWTSHAPSFTVPSYVQWEPSNTPSSTGVHCRWCGVNLRGASSITYLNGNMPICDLCLMKARVH